MTTVSNMASSEDTTAACGASVAASAAHSGDRSAIATASTAPAAESLTFDFARAGRADVRVARIFNTYGPQMRLDDGRVVSNMICQALLGDPLTIYGDGSQTRSFCYVADMVDGLIRLMETDVRDMQPVNLGNPEEVSINELCEVLGGMIDHPLRLERRPLPVDDPRRRRPDITRTKSLLGWKPTTPLRTGLERTMSWFRLKLGGNSAHDTAAPRLRVALQ